MKKTHLFLIFGLLIFTSCGDDDLNDTIIGATVNVGTAFNFTHNWDGVNVSTFDFNSIQFMNANGEDMSIEKLRYLISNITFTKSTGEALVYEDYNLIDVTNNSNLTYTPNMQIPTGSYSNVSFTFGFDNTDNYQNYTNLNSASWNVPMMLGGGYHFMQLEGKFIDDSDSETGYAYHTIRAVDNSDPNNLVFQDTFFDVNLGPVVISDNAVFEISMNIAQWFKNPNQWNLNNLNNMLMPNFDAQVMMNQNGQNVFSLDQVTQ